MKYSEIQTKVSEYLNRFELTSQIKDFIHFGQRNIEKAVPWKGSKARSTIETSDHYITLPDRLVSILNFSITDDDREFPLRKKTEDEIKQIYTDLTVDTGRPKFFAIIDSQGEFLVRPTPTESYIYDLSYYRYLPELSSNITNNWITDEVPELLIHMALLQAEPYLKNDKRIKTWASMAAAMMEDMVGEENRRAMAPNMEMYAV